ncbi:MAG: tetratricopeptide repeat protein [Betaproteobacteria bacterium]|nr:tetratricopeptide repeat protein [Betaproteobacteria bacterium]MCL4695662.1 tetratricopeptide repeat protein [Burkholderiaceae bacterium]
MNPMTLNELRAQWQALQGRIAAAEGQADAATAEMLAAERTALERRIVAAVVDGGESAAPAAAGSASASASTSSAATPPAHVSGPFWALAAVFVVIVAVAGYGWKGDPAAVGTPPPGFEQGAAGAGGAGGGGSGAPQHSGATELEPLIKQLEERLAKSPGDHEGWRLLGRSQMALSRFAEAAAAYERALALKPDDAATLTDRADALGVLNGRSLEGEPAKLLDQALKVDPRHVKALVLVGTLEFQRGNYAAAAQRWQQAVDVGPAGDGLVELAREGVAQAKARQAGGAPAAPGASGASSTSPAAAARPGAAPAAANAAATITGSVRLSAALKAQAAPDDVVFVFARPPAGGAPLAIVQKRVADLPAEFTLDDSTAMSPAARLSTANEVVVTARVSKSGQATPQAGDLEGASVPVAPGARGVVVEIASVRK